MQTVLGSATLSEAVFKVTRRFLLVFSAVGLLLFASLFMATFVSQDSIERAGQSFIKQQVQKKLSDSREALTENKYGRSLLQLKDKMLRDDSLTQNLLDKKFDEYVGAAIAQFCKLDCDAKRNVQQSVRKGLESKLSRIGFSLNVVEDLIAEKYDTILSALKRDVRIFLGTNVIMFLFIGLLLLAKRKAITHLVVPSALLSVSVVTCSFLYIFEQNWFFTIIHGSYWGFAYAVYVVIIFLFLLDITINKGRITSWLFNMISNVFGGVSIGLC